jgi:MoaA/NifB/PqqE/SkfB family radical SAM enzyme
MKNELFYENPNFSIVLPGPCQAKCDFCFWYQKETARNWLEKLEYILDTLPQCFYQVSITGGEPTLSPFLLDTLDLLQSRRKKYKKVVLTTNGIKLYKCLESVKEAVDHVNISRHHWLTEENYKIFKTQNIPDTPMLELYAKSLGKKLTFNCVIKDMSVADMKTYLAHARKLGVSNVCFRQEHGDLSPVAIEAFLLKNYKKTGDGGCPVCRSSYFDYRTSILDFKGMNVGIKYSVLEPKDVIDGIYELVFHSDGKLTADWEANVEIDLVKA